MVILVVLRNARLLKILCSNDGLLEMFCLMCFVDRGSCVLSCKIVCATNPQHNQMLVLAYLLHTLSVFASVRVLTTSLTRALFSKPSFSRNSHTPSPISLKMLQMQTHACATYCHRGSYLTCACNGDCWPCGGFVPCSGFAPRGFEARRRCNHDARAM